MTTSSVPQVYSQPLRKNKYVHSPWCRTATGGPHSAYTSFSLIPGAMVPVSGELYGTSRVTCASGYWGGGGAGLARRPLSASPPMAVSAPGSAAAAWGGGGGGGRPSRARARVPPV